MATATSIVLISTKYMETSATTQYTSTNIKTYIDKFTLNNVTASTVTVSISLVESGDTASLGNQLISSRPIPPGKPYLCPELTGQLLDIGDFIATLSGTGSAIVMRATGRTVVET